LYDSATGKEERRFQPKDFPRSLALAPDGATVAVVHPTRVDLVTLATGNPLRTLVPVGAPADDRKDFRGNHLWPAAFASDGKTLLARGPRMIDRWDVASGNEIPRSTGHQGPVNYLAFGVDGKTLVSASLPSAVGAVYGQPAPWDRSMRCWDLANGT